jgi:hypothetical protein
MKIYSWNAIVILAGIILFPIAAHAEKPVKPITIENLYASLYIGEALHSGFIYIEPFGIDRDTEGKELKFIDHPDSIIFYPCHTSNQGVVYHAAFDSLFHAYVPDTEEESEYFSQPFSKPAQYGLRYKTGVPPKKSATGVVLFQPGISNIDHDVDGKKRPYSDTEYRTAQNEIKKDKEIKESDRTLGYIGLENTIVGATQIMVIHFTETRLTLRISEYETHGFEYTAAVYVLDVLQDGTVVKTLQKHNWDGPL